MYQVTLGAREYINQEAEEIKEENHQHPKDSTVHPARLCISGYPNQQSNAQCQKNDRYKDKCATTATSCGTATGVV